MKKGEIMKNVLKKIGSVLVDVLIVIVFIISTLVVIASVTANRTGGQPSVMGYVFSSVQTDSMQGTINKGDFVVGKLIDSNTEIKEGDIISFYDYLEGKQIVVTHTVVEVLGADTNDPGYITKGDNEERADEVVKTRKTVQSVYKFRIPFLGGFIDFLKTPFGFIICLVIPLLAFIAFQAYKLISLYLKAKKLELAEEANNASQANNSKTELSEEEKNAIIAEYLAKQALEKQAAESKSANEEKSDAKLDEDSKAEEESEAKEETNAEEEPEAKEESEAEAEEESEAEEETEAKEETEAEKKGDEN